MITLKQCAKLAGLDPGALVVGVTPTARHYTLLKSYHLLNLHHGGAAVRRMIVCDLLSCLDIGALRCAADLVVVLRLFLSEAGRERPETPPRAALPRSVSQASRIRRAPSRPHVGF